MIHTTHLVTEQDVFTDITNSKNNNVMSRKTKQQKAVEAWDRFYCKVVNEGDLKYFQEKLPIYENIYGKVPSYLWWRMRYNVFHNMILPFWMRDTYIEHRNALYEITKSIFGLGLANELQRIDSKRTW